MYEETTQGSLVGAANVAGRLSAPDVSPLQAAFNIQGDSIDKLSGLFGELEHRLLSVRNQSPQEQPDQKAAEQEPASPMVGQLLHQHVMILNLQSRVQTLLSELQV